MIETVDWKTVIFYKPIVYFGDLSSCEFIATFTVVIVVIVIVKYSLNKIKIT